MVYKLRAFFIASLLSVNSFLSAADFNFNAALYLMIDNSLSMRNSDSEGQRFSGLDLLIDELPSGVELASGLFHGETRSISAFTALTDSTRPMLKAKLREEASLLDYYTDTHAALAFSLEQLQTRLDSSMPRFLFILSDGSVNVRAGDEATAEKLQAIYSELMPLSAEKNIRIFSLAVTADTDTALLASAAANTGGRYYFVSEASQLPAAFVRISSDLKQMIESSRILAVQKHAEHLLEKNGKREAIAFAESHDLQLASDSIRQKNSRNSLNLDSGLLIISSNLILLLLILYSNKRNQNKLDLVKKQLSELAVSIAKVRDEYHDPTVFRRDTPAEDVLPPMSQTPPTMSQTPPPDADSEPAELNSGEIDSSDGDPAPDSDDNDEEEFIRSTDIPTEETQSTAESESSQGAHCTLHKDRIASSWCTRCGKTYCDLCDPDADPEFICEECRDSEDTKKYLGLFDS